MIPYFVFPTFKVFSLDVSVFSITLTVGFILALRLAYFNARKNALHLHVIHRIAQIALVCGIFGAHAVDLMFYRPDDFKSNPFKIFEFLNGLSSMGAIVFGSVSVLIYLKLKKLPINSYVNALLPSVCLGWTFGRMGCFFVHDHLGKLSNFALALAHPNGSRHDLGFYEMLVWMVLLFIAQVLVNKKNKMTFAHIGLTYFVVRFFLDFLRISDLEGADARYASLTPAQWICLAMTGVMVYSYIRRA